MNEVQAQRIMNPEAKALGFSHDLDLITDAVLAYKPKPKSKAGKRRERRKKREAKENGK